MIGRRVVLLVIATAILWKCLTALLSPFSPRESLDEPPTPVERAPPQQPSPAATAQDSITLQHRLGPASNRRILRGQILLALQEQQVALDLCVPVGGVDKMLVSLELELRDGAAHVEDVSVITEDTPDTAMVACVETALRGRTLNAPSAKPTAKRTRVVFRLEDA